MPEINYECQATRDLVKNMAKYWLSFGLDGFRLDAVKHIYMKDEVDNTGNDIIITVAGSMLTLKELGTMPAICLFTTGVAHRVRIGLVALR